MKHLGIDVSSNNGLVDWSRVKDDDIKFAIIRVGYGSDIQEQDDDQAVRNMQECERLGIPYGVYLYSYALNLNQAESEAQHTLRMIQGFNPTLGVWYDMEDADGYKEKHNFSPYSYRQEITDFCRHFCSKIKENGYNVGIYASKNYWDNILYAEQLSDFPVWLAHWQISEPSMPCLMWQYTSSGSVSGISGRVDMDYYYDELPILDGESEEQGTNNEYSYKVGDTVKYDKIYSTSNSTEVLKPLFTEGTITSIAKGARNPYLIGGGTGWINDDCIVSSSENQSSENNDAIKVGDTVRFTGKQDYNGTYITAYHNDSGYTVAELNSDRAVLKVGGTVFAAVNICDIEKI